MNSIAIKIIETYTNLIGLPEDKIPEVLDFVKHIKARDRESSSQRIGQLAGLCEVTIPDNLETEIRLGRKEISTIILSREL